MSEVFGVMKLLIGCGTLLVVSFCILLAMPQSKMRAVAVQVVGWLMVAFCAVYAISPIDILPEALFGPFGLFDDIGAILTAIAAGSAAMNARKNEAEMKAV